MSVPKSERRQSDVEYITILQEIEIYFLNQVEKNKDNPKYRLISEILVKLSMEAYNEATKLFEMTRGTISGDKIAKKKTAKRCLWSIREVSSQINIFVALKMKEDKSPKELVMLTQRLLKAFELINKVLETVNE